MIRNHFWFTLGIGATAAAVIMNFLNKASSLEQTGAAPAAARMRLKPQKPRCSFSASSECAFTGCLSTSNLVS